MNIKDISTNNLIAELKSRGASTRLLVTTGDIDLVLSEINDKRGEDRIEFTDDEKQEIIKSLDYEMPLLISFHIMRCWTRQRSSEKK